MLFIEDRFWSVRSGKKISITSNGVEDEVQVWAQK
ncbi:hypothetical protein CIPAW_03G239200 [Carya illinoinensis]|uniref:Uncharacterized protein n=1 Tax=Carya illinoinensis TaxID=32201 RepID=A0A8T1R7P3_CARIL|nr:hypothetical protein CIPAW_03G239200 [Carya illinoinensis]